MKATKALESLRASEAAAQKAQAAIDRAESRWNKAMAALRNTPEWKAYCAERGYSEHDYRFSDILA